MADGQSSRYDVGDCIFDGSLLIIGDGIFEVRATPGDDHLHERDFYNGTVDVCTLVADPASITVRSCHLRRGSIAMQATSTEASHKRLDGVRVHELQHPEVGPSMRPWTTWPR